MKVSKLDTLAAIAAALVIAAPLALATTPACAPSIGAIPDNLVAGVVDMYGYAPDAQGNLVVAGTRPVKATTWAIKTPSDIMNGATITYVGWIHAVENVSISASARNASTAVVKIDDCTIPATGKTAKMVFASGWHNVRVTVVPESGHQATINIDVPGEGAFVAYGASLAPKPTVGNQHGQDHHPSHHHRWSRFHG